MTQWTREMDVVYAERNIAVLLKHKSRRNQRVEDQTSVSNISDIGNVTK